MGITCRPYAGGTGVQNTPVPKIGHVIPLPVPKKESTAHYTLDAVMLAPCLTSWQLDVVW